MPDVIGADGEADDAGGPADVPDPSANLAMLGGEIVSAETLASLLQTSFGWVVEWRKRECYQLADDKAGTLAHVWHPVINNWWAKFAPQFLMQWSMANPGLFSAILTTAVVVGPMIQADMKQTAKEQRPRVTGDAAQVVMPKAAQTRAQSDWKNLRDSEEAA